MERFSKKVTVSEARPRMKLAQMTVKLSRSDEDSLALGIKAILPGPKGNNCCGNVVSHSLKWYRDSSNLFAMIGKCNESAKTRRRCCWIRIPCCTPCHGVEPIEPRFGTAFRAGPAGVLR